MKFNFKKTGFYLLIALAIFSGQFLINRGLITGRPPVINPQTISGQAAMEIIDQGPAIIYFWAEWCGVCKMMQNPVSKISQDYPVLTVAVKSGDQNAVQKYIDENALNWKVVNDPLGKLAEKYQVRGVPSLFFLNKTGEIGLTASGYTSEFGLRIRMWLVNN